MSILDSIFGHSGHYVGMVYHAPGEPHVGCPYCKQPARLSNASHGYQPTGPRLDPNKVFAPGQLASGAHPPMTTCQQSSESTDPDSARAHLAFAAEDIRSAAAHVELACADSRVDVSVRKALDALRDALTVVEAEAEAGDEEDE